MSKSEEEYLNQLLESMNQLDEMGQEEDFFEEDLRKKDLLNEPFMDEELSEDFLKEFEAELSGITDADAEQAEDVSGLEALLGMEETPTFPEVDSTEDIESIISGAKEQMSAADYAQTGTAAEDLTAADIFSGDGALEMDAAAAESMPLEEKTQADEENPFDSFGGIDFEMDTDGSEQTDAETSNEDALFDFLAESSSENEASESSMPDLEEAESAGEASADKKKKREKKKKEKNPEGKGFWAKLGTILFGEDEEEEAGVKQEAAEIVTEAAVGNSEEFSDETLDLFKDFTVTSDEPAAEPEKPEDKKKEKKKKEKKKKEKKEKKPKPKKEKKPKKPKEPDNTPPLPKKPVALIFVMAASFVALILIGTELSGYSNALENAKNAYAKQNYTEAYTYVSGLEIKEEDAALYEKYQTMAVAAGELEAYEALMNGEFYDMALDCLIRTVGRCEKYKEEAQNYGCVNELNALRTEAEAKLSEHFSLNSEQALALYNYRDRSDYSKALNEILKEFSLWQ